MDLIKKYCREDLALSDTMANRVLASLEKNEDIFKEFGEWVKTRNYDFQYPVTVEGYTAKQIHEIAPFLEGIGVYNFLVYLREMPEKAKAYMDAGFPRK